MDNHEIRVAALDLAIKHMSRNAETESIMECADEFVDYITEDDDVEDEDEDEGDDDECDCPDCICDRHDDGGGGITITIQ